MGALIWRIVGILLLAITIFVHRNTYTFFGNNRMPFPVWALIVVVVLIGIAMIPVVNLLVFMIGAIIYLVGIAEREIVFRCDKRWWKSIKGFLCKEV